MAQYSASSTILLLKYYILVNNKMRKKVMGFAWKLKSMYSLLIMKNSEYIPIFDRATPTKQRGRPKAAPASHKKRQRNGKEFS